nr:hypothetical protein Itr_chr05CG23810 [Ipomoea trifida]GMC98569.1 hypothetical protein Iba_chr05dCG17770 [Ipomoea batatas]
METHIYIKLLHYPLPLSGLSHNEHTSKRHYKASTIMVQMQPFLDKPRAVSRKEASLNVIDRDIYTAFMQCRTKP